MAELRDIDWILCTNCQKEKNQEMCSPFYDNLEVYNASMKNVGDFMKTDSLSLGEF